jgi:hypothetical protein
MFPMDNDEQVVLGGNGASPPCGVATLNFVIEMLSGENARVRKTPGFAKDSRQCGGIAGARVADGDFETLVQHETNVTRSAAKRTSLSWLNAK